MKKRLLLLLIMILIFPSFVLAEDFTIKTHVKLETGTLKGGEFTFVLKDDKGNVVDTKKNDKDGNITFSPITFDKDNLNVFQVVDYDGSKRSPETFELRIYTIEELNSDKTPYKASEKIWVKAVLNTDGSSEVFYLIVPDIEGLKSNIKQYEANVYHAPASELVGEAYLKLDLSTGEAVMFRDEAGKYTTGLSNGYYYVSDIEHTNAGFSLFSGYRTYVKSVVVKDPIKPDSCREMFSGLENVESMDLSKLDTSNCDNFNMMFYKNLKLKELDLTTFDFSNVTNYGYMFYECESIERIKLPHDLDVSGVSASNMFYMFAYTKNLRYIDMEFLKTFDYMYSGNYMFASSGLVLADLSMMNIDVNQTKSYEIMEGFLDYGKNLVYVNLKNIKNNVESPCDLDLDFYTDTIRVIDVDDKFYARDMSIFYGSVSRHYYFSYNIDNNEFDGVLGLGYGVRNYAKSGRHLFIIDDEEITLTKVLKPVEPKENIPVKNPKTGIGNYIVIDGLIAGFLYSIYSLLKKRNTFKQL